MGFFDRLTGSKQATSDDRTLAEPGAVRGRHYTEWIEHVKQLKREGRHQEVVDLCTEVMDAAEAEQAEDELSVVPPWWYDQVALAARRLAQPDVEAAAMRRYLAQPGRKHPEYVAKFTKNLQKLAD